jgi:hypothetical protein
VQQRTLATERAMVAEICHRGYETFSVVTSAVSSENSDRTWRYCTAYKKSDTPVEFLWFSTASQAYAVGVTAVIAYM